MPHRTTRTVTTAIGPDDLLVSRVTIKQTGHIAFLVELNGDTPCPIRQAFARHLSALEISTGVRNEADLLELVSLDLHDRVTYRAVADHDMSGHAGDPHPDDDRPTWFLPLGGHKSRVVTEALFVWLAALGTPWEPSAGAMLRDILCDEWARVLIKYPHLIHPDAVIAPADTTVMPSTDRVQ